MFFGAASSSSDAKDMEALGVAANIVGVSVPAAHAIRLLRDDIQRNSDAPSTVISLRAELIESHNVLASLRTIGDEQWNALGGAIVAQSKSAISSCEQSCVKLRDALHRWTRHSDEASGTLAPWDRINVGFFKQSQLKTMTAAVEKCKTTLALVVTVGTLYAAKAISLESTADQFT